jgi:ribosomal protein S18 acetylase RimI-like enzyme
MKSDFDSIVEKKCSCFDWRELATLFKEIFSNIPSREIDYILRKHKKGIRLFYWEGKLIGFYVCFPKENPRRLWLEFIGVRENFQNKGIGYYLIKKLENDAQKCGYSRIELAVRKDNLTAIHFYEKNGYTRLPNDESKWIYYKEIFTSTEKQAKSFKYFRNFPITGKIHWRIVYWLLVDLRKQK